MMLSGNLRAAMLAASMLGAIPAGAATIGRAPVDGLADLGVSRATIRVALVLAYRNPGDLERLVAAQQDPGSPLYHRYLTSAEFNALYAPEAAAHARVLAALREAGFTVRQTWSNRTVIDAEAPADVAARFFSTSFHDVMQPGVGRRYANVTAATVPAAIAADVTGVAGLSNLRAYSLDFRFGTPQAQGDARTPAGTPIKGPDGGYGPVPFTNSYALLSKSGFTGTGQTIAITIDGDYLDSDISAYLSTFKVSRTGTISRRLVDGGPGSGLNGASSQESTLDIETTSSLATGANILVYEGVDFTNTANFLDTWNAIVADNQASVVNASYGFCETAFGTFATSLEAIALQGTALGITFNASTGDDGDVTYGCNTKSVNVPSAAPHVTAVGGTTLKVTAQGAFSSEKAWTSRFPTLLGATGGGVSTVFALPSWQSGVKGVIASGRNLPDTSFDANPNTGESFYYNGKFGGPIGGTSLASPIFSSALAMLNQQKGHRAGWFNPVLYAGWKQAGYGADFRDITQGSGGNTIGGGYTVKAGYDQVTGIGATIWQAASGVLNY
jgi:kumamolisin